MSKWNGFSLLLCALLTRCSGESPDEGNIRSVSQALDSTQLRVLGFEAPLADWSSPSGTLSEESTHSEGDTALGVIPNGFTVVQSIALSSLGSFADNVRIDVRVPEAPSWGDIRLIFEAPSAYLWWTELQPFPLANLEVGAFNTIEFTLPSLAKAALSGDYNDLVIRVAVNGPSLTAPYLIDNLVLTESGGGGTSEPPSEGEPSYGSLTMSLPTWALPRTNAAVALNELRVNDNVLVKNRDDDWANVASLGASAFTNIGVKAQIGDVTSYPTIELRNDSDVWGNASTAGIIHWYSGAEVHGSYFIDQDLQSGDVSFTLDLPGTGPSYTSSAGPVAPGRYHSLSTQGGPMTLRAGVYALDELYVSPAYDLAINADEGPVVVLVADSAIVHGTVKALGGGFPRWILAYGGAAEVAVNRKLTGAYFAPNAKVNVATTVGNHEGVVFARDVELHQNAGFVQHYDGTVWDALCEVMKGQGGFCPLAPPDAVREDCLYAVNQWIVGRNGQGELNFPELPNWAYFANSDPTYALVLDFLDEYPKYTDTARGWVHTITDSPSLIGKDWGRPQDLNVAAWGDIDGDGRDELVLGRGASDEERILIHDDSAQGFRKIASRYFASTWGQNAEVRALAIGDVNHDGDDEIVVGRSANQDQPGHPEIFVLDYVSPPTSTGACPVSGDHVVHEIRNYNLGGKHINGLAVADTDGDGYQELLVVRNGGGAGNNILTIIEIEEQLMGMEVQSIGLVESGSDRNGTAVVVGNIDGIGLPEIFVGRNAGGGTRIAGLRYNDETRQYEGIGNFGQSWGNSRYVTDMAMGDVDGDGDDELVVGRNGCDGACSTPGPRVFVYDAPIVAAGSDGFGPTLIQTIGDNLIEDVDEWGDSRTASAVAAGDIDGDGRAELIAGRGPGTDERVLIYDDANAGFQRIRYDHNWGQDRGVLDVAVGKHPVCLMREASELPDSVAEANMQFEVRKLEPIQRTIASFLSTLEAGPECSSDFLSAVFTEWPKGAEEAKEKHGDFYSLQRILAGLLAIDLDIQPEADTLIDAGFPALVSDYIVNQVDGHKGLGSAGDFDFVQMSFLSILYRFRSTLHDGEYLLSDAAVEHLTGCGHDLPCASDFPSHLTFPLLPDDSVSNFLRSVLEAALLLPPGTLEKLAVPESENHALMINTWNYLWRQWVDSDSPRVALEALPDDGGELSELKAFLMAALGRFAQNGAFETNANAYQAFSIRAIMLLASYALDSDIKTAATNALDTITTKYAFQALHGKRSAPMRRRWEHRNQTGFYTSNHVNVQLGILTGDLVVDTDAECGNDVLCIWRDRQKVAFAMEAAAAASASIGGSLQGYRVPEVVHDLMLHPDDHNDGYGAWARMQARYTEDHYVALGASRYPVPSAIPGQPDLNQEIANGERDIEPTPEFYFLAKDYMNSAGGGYAHYDIPWVPDASNFGEILEALEYLFGVGGVSWPGAVALEVYKDDLEKVYEPLVNGFDFAAKPTMLIGSHDLGVWQSAESGSFQTLLMQGGEAHPAKSNNTGVYKNLAYGYSVANTRGYPFRIPPSLSIAHEESVGSATFAVVDPKTTGLIFSNDDYLLVLGNYTRESVLVAVGFWEVVPRRVLPEDIQDPARYLLDRVVANNEGNSNASPLKYKTAVSGEVLTFNPSYPIGPPFLEITGDGMGGVNQVHLPSGPARNLPMMDVRQVDDNYGFTGVHYACANGDGVIVVNNPHIEETTAAGQLIIDSRDHQNPKRAVVSLAANGDPCPDILAGNPYSLPTD